MGMRAILIEKASQNPGMLIRNPLQNLNSLDSFNCCDNDRG